jgi:hypothetical protein
MSDFVDLTVRVRVPRTLSKKHVLAVLRRADPDFEEVSIDEETAAGGPPPERDREHPPGPGGLLGGRSQE